MIVILEDPVFASSPASQLLSAIRFGVEGWHLIQTDPVFNPGADRAVNRWLAAQSESIREEVELALAIGVEEEALGSPSSIYLRIGEAAQVDWNAVPLRLPMESALALTWSPEFDLNERMQEIRDELGEVGWQDLEEKMILHTCKAALDLDIYYSEVLEIRDAIKKRPQILRQVTDAIKAAADLLKRNCKVCGPAVLPYSFQIVLLADAIQRGTECFQKPLTSEIYQSLARWFWLTTYTEYFAGISAVRLVKALEHVRKIAGEGVGSEPPGMSREVRPLRRFDFRSARSRAIALRLADVRYLEADLDHDDSDPYQLLADYGSAAVLVLIPPGELQAQSTRGPENRILAHPAEVTRIRQTLRGRGPIDFLADDDDEVGDAALYRSHAISADAAEALRKGNLVEFLHLRREALMEMEQSQVEALGLTYSRS